MQKLRKVFLTSLITTSIFCAFDKAIAKEITAAFISGEKLISQYKGERPYPAQNAEVGKALSIEYASGYLSGIFEITAGTQWCNTHGIPPGELKAYVQDYIEKLPSKERAKEARGLVVHALKKRYPCK